MAQKWITGVSLRKDCLEWTVLRRVKEGWAVARQGRADLEGRALDGAFLKGLQHPFKGAVVLGLPLEEVLLRVAPMPSTDPGELLEMAELQVEKFAPYGLESMAYGAESLAVQEDGETLLAMAAARLESVEAAGAAFQEVGVLPDCVDLSCLGWWHGLRSSGTVPDSGEWMAVRLDASCGDVLLARDGRPVRAFVLPGVPAAEAGEGASDEDDGAAAAPDGEVLKAWASECREQLSYELMAAEADNGVTGRAGITILFEGAAAKAAAEALAAEWGQLDGITEVRVASAEDLPTASEGLARRYAEPAGGLALDLAPASWQEAERERQFRRRLLQVSGAFVAVWAAAVLVFLGWLHVRRASLAEAEAQAQALERPAMAVRALRATLNELQVYADRSASPLECLRAVSIALPPGVTMNSFVYVKGQDLKIRGEAKEAQSVYDFVAALENSGLFPAVHNDGVNTRAGQTAFLLTAFLPGSTNAVQQADAGASAAAGGGAS